MPFTTKVGSYPKNITIIKQFIILILLNSITLENNSRRLGKRVILYSGKIGKKVIVYEISSLKEIIKEKLISN